MAGILNPAAAGPAKFSTTLAGVVDPLICVRNLVKTHGSADQGNLVTVLDGVDVDFSRGQFNVIMGTSGAGKSSFLRCVAGLDSFDSGSVTVNGQDLAQMSVAERSEFRLDSVGIIFAAHNLVPSLSVEENIELPALLRRQPVDEDRLEALISQLGLQDKLKLLPEDLSVEARQKVACARALVMQPDVIFADEPTANLDTGATDQILEFLRWVTRERQETVVLATHDPNVACYADRVLFLCDGRILAQLENPTPDALVDAQRAVNEMRPSVPSSAVREPARASRAEMLPRSKRISPYASAVETPAAAAPQIEPLAAAPAAAAFAAANTAMDTQRSQEETAPSARRSHKTKRVESRRSKERGSETSFEVEIPDNPLRMSGDLAASGFSWPKMAETPGTKLDSEIAAAPQTEMSFEQVVSEPVAPAEPAAHAETFEEYPTVDKTATGAPTFFSIREFAREMGNSPLEDTQGDLRLGDGLVARVNQSAAEQATRYRSEPLRRPEFERVTAPDEVRPAQPVPPVVPTRSAPPAPSVKIAPKRSSIVPSASSAIPAATAASTRYTPVRSPKVTAAPATASATPLEPIKTAKPSAPAESAKVATPLTTKPTTLPTASKLSRSERPAASVASRTPAPKPVETAPAETPQASNTPKRPRRRTLNPREAEQRGQDELMEKIRQAERLLADSRAAITDASRDLNQAESEARKTQAQTGYRGNVGLPKAGQTPDQELLIARADAMMAQANLRSVGLRESLRRLDSTPRPTSES